MAGKPWFSPPDTLGIVFNLLSQDPGIGHACCATPERGPCLERSFTRAQHRQGLEHLSPLARTAEHSGSRYSCCLIYCESKIRVVNDTIITLTVKSGLPPSMTSPPLKSCPRTLVSGWVLPPNPKFHSLRQTGNKIYVFGVLPGHLVSLGSGNFACRSQQTNFSH